MTDSNIDVQDRQLVARRIPLLQRRKPVAFVLKNNAMANLQPAEQLQLIAAVARLFPSLDDGDKLRLHELTFQTLRKIATTNGQGNTQAATQALKLIETNNQLRLQQNRGGVKVIPLLATDDAAASIIEEICVPCLSAPATSLSLSKISVALNDHIARQPHDKVREHFTHQRLVDLRSKISPANKSQSAQPVLKKTVQRIMSQEEIVEHFRSLVPLPPSLRDKNSKAPQRSDSPK